MAETLLANTGMVDLKLAEGRFLQVLDIDPGNVEALNLLAQLCARTQRHTKSRRSLARALDDANGDREDGAKTIFERAIALDPEDRLIQGNLEYCLELMGKRAGDEPRRRHTLCCPPRKSQAGRCVFGHPGRRPWGRSPQNLLISRRDRDRTHSAELFRSSKGSARNTGAMGVPASPVPTPYPSGAVMEQV